MECAGRRVRERLRRRMRVRLGGRRGGVGLLSCRRPVVSRSGRSVETVAHARTVSRIENVEKIRPTLRLVERRLLDLGGDVADR